MILLTAPADRIACWKTGHSSENERVAPNCRLRLFPGAATPARRRARSGHSAACGAERRGRAGRG